jgi:uncharacterized protein DUF4154
MVSGSLVATVGKAVLYASLWIAWNSLALTKPSAPTEYEVKAAFIYNFGKYIAWPASPDSNKPFVIGLIGKDPFGRVLDEAMRGQTVQDRPVIVRRFTRVEQIRNCDILFIASSEKANVPHILSTLGKSPVVTIGDMARFAERGGMINLTMQRDRVRFEVNIDAFTRVGLKAGSQLLRLARIVPDHRAEYRP